MRRLLKSQLAVIGAHRGRSFLPCRRLAARNQWSMFEDHTALVRASCLEAPARPCCRRSRTSGRTRSASRCNWNEVAPQPNAKTKPAFDSSNPFAYPTIRTPIPSFFPYDDLVRQGERDGLQDPDDAHRRHAPLGQRRRKEHELRDGQHKPSTTEFAKLRDRGRKALFGAAIRASRRCGVFSIWNEPNHVYFIKPDNDSPRIYRKLVNAAVPAIRANGAPGGAKVFVGELAPVGRAAQGDRADHLLQEVAVPQQAASSAAGAPAAANFKKIDADGLRPPPLRPRRPCRQEAGHDQHARDRAARRVPRRGRTAGRIPRKLPIYNTEFGYQSNPPDRHGQHQPSRTGRAS